MNDTYISSVISTVTLCSVCLNCYTTETLLAHSTAKNGKNPQETSDIVGRDLKVFGLGALGHVGLWTGDKVIEALDQTPAIVENTLADFKSKASYWGAIYYPGWNKLPSVELPSKPRMRYEYIMHTARAAASRRAKLIKEIGATYTIFPTPKIASVEICDGRHCSGPLEGIYRCDTFVKDAYMAAGVDGLNFGLTDTPASLWNTYTERR